MYVYNSNPTTTNSAPAFSTSTWTKVSDLTIHNYHGKAAGTYYIWYYCKVSDTTNNTGNNINTVKSVSKKILSAPTTCTQTDAEGICGGYEECMGEDGYYINTSYDYYDGNVGNGAKLSRGLCFTYGNYCYVYQGFATNGSSDWKADSDLSMNFSDGLNTGHCTTNNCYLFQPRRAESSAWATTDSGIYLYAIYDPKNASPKCKVG